MTAPDANSVCVETSVDPSLDGLAIVFPGGINIAAQLQQDVATAYDAARSLMGGASSALAPLGPILLLIKCIQDLAKCIADVPGILGPPPNPAKLINDLEALAVDVDQLIGVAPPMSVPALIKSMLKLIITFLNGIIEQLSAMEAIAEAIEAATTRAGALAALGAVGAYAASQLMVTVGCTRSTLTAQLQGMAQGMGPLGQVLGILNDLGEAVGIELPAVGTLDASAPPSSSLGPLQAAVAALSDIEAAIIV